MADGYALVELPLLQFRFAYIDEQKYESFIGKLKKNQMNIDEISGGHIKATVSIPDGKKLFTTIPYDDGWKVYADGQKTEITKVADTFVGLNLSPGEHKLEFKYVPAGFYPGLAVTIISWILFVVYMIYVYRRVKADIVEEETDVSDKEKNISENETDISIGETEISEEETDISGEEIEETDNIPT